jgi:hypothetical protein
MSERPNWDEVKVGPASAPAPDHDPFGDARMGARPLNVSMTTDLQSLPSCNDIFGTVQAMDTRTNSHLLQRMDQFVGGTLNSQGVTFDQLQAMSRSNQFSPTDKMALGTMEKLFQSSSGLNGDASHMTIKELALGMITAASREQCQVPGQGAQNGPPRKSKM